MKKGLSFLSMCLTLYVQCVHSQTGYVATPEFCCNTQPSPKVLVTPNNIEEVVNDSPHFEIIATRGFYSQGFDNVCHTYFPLGDDCYVRITTLTFSNGTLVVQKYIFGPLTGYPGVGRIQGLTEASGSSILMYDEAFLGSPCPGVRVYYRKYVAGSCNLLQDVTKDGTDSRHGDANTRCISDYCLRKVLSIANSQNFNGSDFVKYPFKLNANCVTQFNGMSCVNADKVRPQDSISLPDTGSSCQTPFY